MGVAPTTSVWAPSVRPLTQAKPWRAKGPHPLPRLRRDGEHKPVSVRELALNLPEDAWRTITWREGTNASLKGRFARVRVHAAHRDNLRSELRPEEWLVIEWPESEEEPTKYWLSTLPPDIAFDQLVDAIKLRWRIERDYQELKQEVGLGHYEGRGWRGFHHHATLCIAAYGFLIAESQTIPPSGHPRAGRFQTSACKIAVETPPRWGWTGRGYAARAYFEGNARAAYLASKLNAFSCAYIICLKRRVLLIEVKIMFLPAKQTAIASDKVAEIRGGGILSPVQAGHPAKTPMK
jgi:hypothetical protein